ncbi:hypothetical protein FOL47_009703 [Perkinsus chesapeaki]|uniref:Uncharacterized protein n=1 Tax=Perkinsus chesapeaki TaxID=330153 RepID=A0A7J6L6V1_PERCH|nr:hypothetical protein FOL47_009703 [Perkinsus chesapeaki]
MASSSSLDKASDLVAIPGEDGPVHLSAEERHHLLNVVSPLEHVSPMLDPQVPTTGHGTAASFTIYANEPMVKLVPRLSSRGKVEDLVVNVVMRAVDAQCTKEPVDRMAAVDQLQSELYVAISLMLDRHFAHPKSHHIFALLNRDIVKKVAPKIKRKQYQLVKDMVYQPLLRFGITRSGNIGKFDPNYILEAAGPYGFMTVYKRLPMDITKLTGRNFDTIMSCRLNKHEHVTFDGISLLLAMRPLDFWLPVTEGSQWSLKRAVEEICWRRSSHMLRNFLEHIATETPGDSEGRVWRECVNHLRSRDPDTGLLLDQWAYETVTTIVWEAAGSIDRETDEARMIEAPRYEDFENDDDDEELHESEMTVWDESTTDSVESIEEELPFDELIPLSEDRIFLLSSPAHLAAMYRRMRQELKEHNDKLAELGSPTGRDWLVALNYEENEAEDDLPFPPSVFTIATPSATYVIDISCLHSDIMISAGFQTTLKFVLDWLLKEPSIRKVCMVFTNLLQRLNTLMYGFRGDPAGTQLAVDEEEEMLDWNDSEQVRSFANDDLRASNWAADRDVADMKKIQLSHVSSAGDVIKVGYRYTNVVDLRQRRVRKVERWKENGMSDPSEVAEMMLNQSDIVDTIAKAKEHDAVARGSSSVPATLSYEIELHGGLMSSRALVHNYVGKEDSSRMILTPGERRIRRQDINWDFRPLAAAAVLLSAEDAYILMLVEHRMTRRLDIHAADGPLVHPHLILGSKLPKPKWRKKPPRKFNTGTSHDGLEYLAEQWLHDANK